jgi:hypothetical protein
LLVLSMLLVSAGALPGWWLLLNAAIVGAAVLFERSGYTPHAAQPERLQPTGERFQDPTSGELVEVWEDPTSGVREYRPAVHKTS